MGKNKPEELIIQVPKGVKSVKIEFEKTPTHESAPRVTQHKICD